MSKKETQAQQTKKAPAKVAKKIAKTNKKGKEQRKHRVYTKVRFYRPKVFELQRKPRYARSSSTLFASKVSSSDKYSVLKYPLNTEKAMKRIEDENTLVYIVDNQATKGKIRDAIKQLHNVNIRSINTLNRYCIVY